MESKRTIKFRAWDSTAKEMFFPKTIKTDWEMPGSILCCEDSGPQECRTVRFDEDGNEIIEVLFLTPARFSEILMQWTGLEDSRGVEIYDKDLLNFGDNYGIVEVLNDIVWVHFNNLDSIPLYKIHSNMVEVIGNIYENTELVKEE